MNKIRYIFFIISFLKSISVQGSDSVIKTFEIPLYHPPVLRFSLLELNDLTIIGQIQKMVVQEKESISYLQEHYKVDAFFSRLTRIADYLERFFFQVEEPILGALDLLEKLKIDRPLHRIYRAQIVDVANLDLEENPLPVISVFIFPLPGSERQLHQFIYRNPEHRIRMAHSPFAPIRDLSIILHTEALRHSPCRARTIVARPTSKMGTILKQNGFGVCKGKYSKDFLDNEEEFNYERIWGVRDEDLDLYHGSPSPTHEPMETVLMVR